MNARDNIKPKSIRLAILAGLSNGAITTIDDLQIRIGEPRKKVAQNVYPAAIDGLIRRMKDDITGGPAYQITDKGREYLAKYADGSKAEPAPEQNLPNCAKSQTDAITTDEKSVVDLQDNIVQKEKELAQKDAEIERLNRLFFSACADLGRINEHLGLDPDDGGADPIIDAIDEIKESLVLARMARAVTPSGYVVQRPAKPLTRFSKIENAKARAMSFARGGKRSQVFALVPVGVAFPGAEWRE